MDIQVNGDEPVHCVVLDGTPVANRRAIMNSLRMGAQYGRLVVIGDKDVIAATLGSMALSPKEVECAPIGTELPQGTNVVSIKASVL
jgi:hypothetical protein